MDENNKKKLLLILSCLAMLTFIFFAFFQQKKNKSNTDDFINPARLDHNPSKAEAYAQKRKREHQLLVDTENNVFPRPVLGRNTAG